MRQLARAFLLLLASVLFVEARPPLLGEPTFDYDVQTEQGSAYDGFARATFDYDARAVLSASDVLSEAANCTYFERSCEFLAAKTGADSALQGARLGEHLRQLEKYGQAGFKELESGRLRYYGNINPATTPGTMAGRRLVREWDPSTGAARTWHETVDQAGRVRIVRPETGGSKVHYMFDEHGNYTGSF